MRPSVILLFSVFSSFPPWKIWLVFQETSKVTSLLQISITLPQNPEERITHLFHCIGLSRPLGGDWTCCTAAGHFVPVSLYLESEVFEEKGWKRIHTYFLRVWQKADKGTCLILLWKKDPKNRSDKSKNEVGWGWEGKAFNGEFQIWKLFFSNFFQNFKIKGRTTERRGSELTVMLIYSSCQFNYELLITIQVEC